LVVKQNGDLKMSPRQKFQICLVRAVIESRRKNRLSLVTKIESECADSLDVRSREDANGQEKYCFSPAGAAFSQNRQW